MTPVAFVTTGVAARELGVSDETVRRMIARGTLAVVLASGGFRLIPRAALDDLIARRRAHETALGGEHVSA